MLGDQLHLKPIGLIQCQAFRKDRSGEALPPILLDRCGKGPAAASVAMNYVPAVQVARLPDVRFPIRRGVFVDQVIAHLTAMAGPLIIVQPSGTATA